MNWRWGWYIVCLVLLGISISCKKESFTSTPLIYGHAGISLSEERAVFPPNSEDAILYGLDVLSADGVEVDAQLTKDGALVLFHDEFVKEHLKQDGCIGDYTEDELLTFDYYGKYKVIPLTKAIEWVVKRRKYLCIDLKHYNYCTESNINYEDCNKAINEALAGISDIDKNRISINSTNLNLLKAIEDSVIHKWYETDKIQFGIDVAKEYGFDKMTIKLGEMTMEKADELRENKMDFVLFGIKSKKEIKEAARFNPNEIISDNVAATRKYYY